MNLNELLNNATVSTADACRAVRAAAEQGQLDEFVDMPWQYSLKEALVSHLFRCQPEWFDESDLLSEHLVELTIEDDGQYKSFHVSSASGFLVGSACLVKELRAAVKAQLTQFA